MTKLSDKQLTQRLENVEQIAKRRREKETCKRGHNNWAIRKDDRRRCLTCNRDHAYYNARGLKYI